MIAVIDYGMGNLRSVSKALEAVGAEVEVTPETERIARAEGIILPGVGAFHHGMKNLRELGIIPVIYDAVRKGTPFLGICLGLQLLFTESHEHGIHRGLDIVKGKVIRFSSFVKTPHMGWNTIKIRDHRTIFEGIPDNSYFYFVHSYYVEPEDKDVISATTEYGIEFTSAIAKDWIWGLQFHPEKSSELGLKILENFRRYVG